MAINRHIKHIKSQVIENGAPKLPTSSQIELGEIAINYANNYETIAIKNSNESIVTFSSDKTILQWITDGKNSHIHQGEFNAGNITEEGWYDSITQGRPEGSESDEKYFLYMSSNGGQVCWSRRNSGKTYHRLSKDHPWVATTHDDFMLERTTSLALKSFKKTEDITYDEWLWNSTSGSMADEPTRLDEVYAGNDLSVTTIDAYIPLYLHPKDIIKVRAMYRRGFSAEGVNTYPYDSDAYIYVNSQQATGHNSQQLKSDYIKVKSMGSLGYPFTEEEINWQDLGFVRNKLFRDDTEYGWHYIKTNIQEEGTYYLHIDGDFSTRGSWIVFGDAEVFSSVNSIVDVVTAITPSNSGSTDPIATSVVAKNEKVVSEALINIRENKVNSATFTAHTASTVHMNNTEKTNLDSLATNIAAISGITSTKVSNWDGAVTQVGNLNPLSGKVSTLSAITATPTAINSLTGSVGSMAYQNTGNYYTKANLTGSSAVTVAKANSATTAASAASAGSAASADKLNANNGSATKPVYFSNGLPSACTYSLSADVPSNAVFTDTATTLNGHYSPSAAAASTKTSSASGGNPLSWGSSIITGVILSGDSKGHVTAVAVSSAKLPSNPNTWRNVTVNGVEKLTTATTSGSLDITSGGTNGTISVEGVDVKVTGLGTMAYQSTNSYSSATQVNTAFESIEEDSRVIAASLNDLNERKVDTSTLNSTLNNYCKISDAEKFIETTYSNLKTLRDGGNLKKGALYRITDYQTIVATSTQKHITASTHQFDVVVMATSANTLNENAWAMKHDNDTYFTNNNLNAWELKYCLDNDTNRFAWANSSSGKGVIYYMKDEFDNECPYDFKNIMFERLYTTSATHPSYSQTSTTSWGIVNKFTRGYDIDNTIFPSLTTGTSSNYFYTFSKLSATGSSPTITDASLTSNSCFLNKIEPTYNDSKFCLNQIVLVVIGTDKNYNNVFEQGCHGITLYSNSSNNSFGVGCYQTVLANSSCTNSFGNECSKNTLGTECGQNSFGNKCYNINLGDEAISNSFGNGCYFNFLGDGSASNSFGNECYINRFGDECCSNLLGSYCHENYFKADCVNNSFGNECSSNSLNTSSKNNSFGHLCTGNTCGTSFQNNILGIRNDGNNFGNNCSNNVFGCYCRLNSFNNHARYNSFGNYCASNTFLKSFMRYFIVENGVSSVVFDGPTTSSSNYLQNITISQSISEASINHNTVGDTFKTTYQKAASTVVNV